MRIGIDGRILRDDFPGIGRYTYNLLMAMQPQLAGDTLAILHDPAVKTRYDLVALSFAPQNSTGHMCAVEPVEQAQAHLATLAAAPGVELVPFPLPPRAFSQQWKLPQTLRRLAVDAFHAPYYVTAYRGLPCPLVVSLFDLIPIAYPPSMPSATGRLAYRVAVRLASGAAGRVIVLSEAARADLIRHFNLPAGCIAVIPAAPAPVFKPAPEAQIRRTRELYRVPLRYILHVGVNKPHKNLETLLEAYHRYYTATPAEERASLVLVGEHDPRYVSPRRWAAQLGLARSVLALGNVPDEDLRALYSGAAGLAFPSLYEGFGLPVLEAMACGAPVLASSASSLPEVAGDAAILLDPHDSAAWTQAIGRLVADPALQADLRVRGLARAGQFSWAAAARATLEIYRSLASQSDTSSGG